MQSVRTTLFAESKNRSVYFDVEEGICIYEEMTGKRVGEGTAEIIRNYAPIINRAYEEGFRDGKKVAHGQAD